jgi:hypothetical protein
MFHPKNGLSYECSTVLELPLLWHSASTLVRRNAGEQSITLLINLTKAGLDVRLDYRRKRREETKSESKKHFQRFWGHLGTQCDIF